MSLEGKMNLELEKKENRSDFNRKLTRVDMGCVCHSKGNGEKQRSRGGEFPCSEWRPFKGLAHLLSVSAEDKSVAQSAEVWVCGLARVLITAQDVVEVIGLVTWPDQHFFKRVSPSFSPSLSFFLSSFPLPLSLPSPKVWGRRTRTFTRLYTGSQQDGSMSKCTFCQVSALNSHGGRREATPASGLVPPEHHGTHAPPIPPHAHTHTVNI